MAEYSPAKPVYAEKLTQQLTDLTEEFINGQLLYLNEEGYIRAITAKTGAGEFVHHLYLTSTGINFVERIETAQDVTEFEKDFSKESIAMFNNISNSTIVMNSSNVSISISNSDTEALKGFFEKIIQNTSSDSPEHNIARGTMAEIEKQPATKEYLRAIGSVLLSLTTSVYANFLTPQVAALLGISFK